MARNQLVPRLMKNDQLSLLSNEKENHRYRFSIIECGALIRRKLNISIENVDFYSLHSLPSAGTIEKPAPSDVCTLCAAFNIRSNWMYYLILCPCLKYLYSLPAISHYK
jgi:hypothetical protein